MEEPNGDSKEQEIQEKDTKKVDLEYESAENDAEEDFEPTIDMLMNEFHDETTIEEEEELDQDLDDDELKDLNAEQEMPIEDLMKLHGYNQTENICVTQPDKEEEKDLGKDVENQDSPNGTKDGSDVENQDSPNGTKDGSDVENQDSPNGTKSIKRKLPICSSFAKKPKLGICGYNGRETDSESSESDNDNTGDVDPTAKLHNEDVEDIDAKDIDVEDTDVEDIDVEDIDAKDIDVDDIDAKDIDATGKLHWWKKTTRIGENYQCEVPMGMSSYDDTPPYQNKDVLVWQSDRLTEAETAEYLAEYGQILEDGAVSSNHALIDNEQALYLLLQCGYNREEALRRTRLNGVAPADVMSLWSEEEVRGFETGLKVYGKQFHSIKEHKVGTRSVAELVQFYYLWKKSDKQADFVDSFKENKTACLQAERRVTL